jgi:Family of unknown function (DUF5681)
VKLFRGRSEGAVVSEKQPDQALTGKARHLANLKPFPKGKSGNPSGKPKDLANFGELLMKEFYKTVIANMAGKTVKRSQGETVAQQVVKNAIVTKQASHMALLAQIHRVPRSPPCRARGVEGQTGR